MRQHVSGMDGFFQADGKGFLRDYSLIIICIRMLSGCLSGQGRATK